MNKIHINAYLAILFLFNCFIGCFIDLSHDEAYYWIYSLDWSWGHYDHPPLVGWVIKLGTFIWGKNELGVRFFFNVMQVASIKLLWDMSNKKEAGTFMLCMLIMPLVFFSGILALPDTPSVFFSILFLKYFDNYLQKDDRKTVLILSLIIALLFYSKYHGVVVVLLSIIAYPKVVLRKSFWQVFLISFALYLPHLYWQIGHDFMTFKYHLFRRKQRVMEIGNVLNFIGNQILVAGAGAFIFAILGLIKKSDRPLFRLIKFNVWGMYTLLLFSSLRNKIEANWTITSCAFLIVVVHLAVTEAGPKFRKYFFRSSAISVMLVTALIGFLFLPESISTSYSERFSEVKNWRNKVNRILEVAPNDKIVANTYQLGAKLSFYSSKLIPVLHYRVRESEFIYVKGFPVYNDDESISFVTYKGPKNIESAEVWIGHPPYAYVYQTSIREILGHGSEN